MAARFSGADHRVTVCPLALNLLRLHGHHSVRAGLGAVAHDIAKLLDIAGIRPGWAT
jgi:HD superfamily phosphohydrolase YqeK